MGVNDRERDRKDELGRAKQEARRRRSSQQRQGSPADWESVNCELLTKAIATVAAIGGALRLGYSKDGGAYAVGIYGDGEPFTEFISPSDDIESYFKGIIEDYGK